MEADRPIDTLVKDLQSLRNQFNDFLYFLPDALLEIDIVTPRLTYMNRMAHLVFGYSEDDFVGGIPVSQLFAESEFERAVEIIRNYVSRSMEQQIEYTRSGKQELYEFRMRRKDGTVFQAETQTSFVLDRNHVPTGMRTLIRDITERKKSEEARLRAAEAEARAQTAEALNRELEMEIAERKRAEADRQQLEMQIRKTQRLDSLGVLAGGLAHDFNNLLTGMLGHVNLAMREIPPESSAYRSLQQAELAVLRAADLTSQMLAYAGKRQIVSQNANITEIVKEIRPLLRTLAAKNVTLAYELAEDLPSITVDVAQVRQAIMNLASNACEALNGSSGAITIRTGRMHADAQYLSDASLEEKSSEGEYLFLEVADTGCGMDGETQARIFDPFFTTKFPGRGLGLPAIWGIMRAHGGAIKLKSNIGLGTTLRLLFPLKSSFKDGLAEEGIGRQAVE